MTAEYFRPLFEVLRIIDVDQTWITRGMIFKDLRIESHTRMLPAYQRGLAMQNFTLIRSALSATLGGLYVQS